MTKLAFLDTETTGLDPDAHEIWEVGLILRDEHGTNEYLWQLPVDLGRADAMALKVGRFHERRWFRSDQVPVVPRTHLNGVVDEPGADRAVLDRELMDDWADRFARLTDGAHLVGAVVSFDEERLRRLLRRHHACPSWHYHLIDVEALAVGFLNGRRKQHESEHGPSNNPVFENVNDLPWKSDMLSTVVGVDPQQFDRHTALGDARWAMAIYDAVMGTT